jgi:aerobic-type carbon monoxide dehydrogenase small subunit (CoxS/CutS family)
MKTSEESCLLILFRNKQKQKKTKKGKGKGQPKFVTVKLKKGS